MNDLDIYGPLGHGVKSGLAEDGVGFDVDSQANLPEVLKPEKVHLRHYQDCEW